MKIKNFSIHTRDFVLFAVLVFSAILSFFLWKTNVKGSKYVFVFESTDSDSLCIENRFINPDKESSKIQNYIEELVLGPISEHCKPIFNSGTKVVSCFERENILYVNLSPELLSSYPEKTDFKEQIALFRKNIHLNFPLIKEVVLFIDGNVPFEY